MINTFNEEDIRLFERVIEARRSIRAFKENPPSDSMIKAVIHAGIYAPYAGLAVGDTSDFRRFFVFRKGSKNLSLVNEMIKETAKLSLEQLEKQMREPFFKEKSGNFLKRLSGFAEKGFPGLTEVPCFIVVAERRGIPPAEKQSLSHTLQNMWLEATVLGLGFRLVSVVESLTENQNFCKLLKVPYGEFAFNGCIIGYAAQNPPARAGFKEESMVTWL